MSHFNISFGQRAIIGYPSPALFGDFRMQVRYTGEPVELTALSFWIKINQATALPWPERSQIVRPIQIQSPHWEQSLTLRVPLDATTVSFIERVRQGGGPLQFEVFVNFYFHRLVPAPQPTDSSQSSPHYVLGSSETQQEQATCTVQRDEWLEVLKTIGWQEYEIFEIPTTPLLRVERFTKALSLLDQAVKAFRAGEYDTCVVHARRALEAAAATTGKDDTNQAFQQLWQAVLPNNVDEPKRQALNQFTFGIGALRQPVAHGGDLHFQLRRSDAQLALTVGIALLRYLGEELERTSTSG